MSRSIIHSAAFSSMMMSSRSADMSGGILGYRNAGAGDTVGTKELAAADQTDRKLGVDGAFRDAEAFGNRAMRESLNSAQREDLPATGRQCTHGGGEKFEFLFMTEGFGRIGPLFYNGQLAEIT